MPHQHARGGAESGKGHQHAVVFGAITRPTQQHNTARGMPQEFSSGWPQGIPGTEDGLPSSLPGCPGRGGAGGRQRTAGHHVPGLKQIQHPPKVVPQPFRRNHGVHQSVVEEVLRRLDT